VKTDAVSSHSIRGEELRATDGAAVIRTHGILTRQSATDGEAFLGAAVELSRRGGDSSVAARHAWWDSAFSR
jgi:hypothetical protein